MLNTTANTISLTRILAITVILAVYAQPWPGARVVAASIYAVAALTDILDGYLARRDANASVLGASLDLAADKLLAISVLIALVARQEASVWMAIVLAGR